MNENLNNNPRFGGIVRLYGDEAMRRFRGAHILVIGIGGVGSWTAEALARTGIGSISLMDLDEICVTNTNRQIHTNKDTIGKSKIGVMAKRLSTINPDIIVHCLNDFIDKNNLQEYVSNHYSVVVDAIDNAVDKTELLAYCSKHSIQCVSVGCSGGKKDPSQIQYGDLLKTTGDPLFAKIRNNLRRYHGFSRDLNTPFGIEVIYSSEPVNQPKNEFCRQTKKIDAPKLDCNDGYGAVSMVTASFGLLAASRVIERLI